MQDINGVELKVGDVIAYARGSKRTSLGLYMVTRLYERRSRQRLSAVPVQLAEEGEGVHKYTVGHYNERVYASRPLKKGGCNALVIGFGANVPWQTLTRTDLS